MSVLISLLASMSIATALSAQSVSDEIPEVEALEPDTASLLDVDPNLTPLVCPFRGSIDYEPGDIECGLITVPENRENADSRLIQIHYVRIAAWGEEEDSYRDDPVIYLTGGPGVGVNSYVGRLKDHHVAEHRDLYILEQRGIGTSTDLCEQYGSVAPAQTSSTNMTEMQIAGAERMRMCFQESAALGIDLSGYSTVENARDVKSLRQALGYETWNVWGISYGSHLGQMLLREDPDGINALVIDAIVPNDLNGLFDYGRNFSQVISNFAETCDEGAMCEDLEARLWAAIASLRDDPVILQIDESEVFPNGEQWVPPAIAAFFPFSMAYEQSEHPAVPAVISAVADFAENRDPEIIAGLESLLAAAGGDDDDLSISQGMSDAIRCNDGYVQEALDAYDKTPPGRWDGILGTREGQAYTAQVCVDEGLSPRDRADYALVRTDVPTLIVNGDWDPVTPPWLAQYIHDAMPGSRLIITPYAGHGPTRSMSECAGPVLNAFFDNPDVEALDATCLEDGVEPPVYAEFKNTNAPFIAAALLADSPESFMVPGIWFGGSFAVLLLGLILVPFGFLGRLIDRTPASGFSAETGGARLTGWFAALSGVSGVGLIGAGAYMASEISQTAVLAGFAAPARIGMWLVLLSGVLGLASLYFLIRTVFGGERIRIGTLLGFALMGISAMALTCFAVTWDLMPF